MAAYFVFTAVAVLILTAILYYRLKNARTVYLINKLPGPPAHFLFGNVLSFMGIRREGKFISTFTQKLFYRFELSFRDNI